MANKEAEQALKLGLSYLEDILQVLEKSSEGYNKEGYQLINTLDLAMKQFDKAESIQSDILSEDGISINIARSDYWALKGLVQSMFLEKRANAIKSFQQSIEIFEDNVIAHYNLGLSYSRTGDKEKGLFHLRRATELEPDNMEFLKVLNQVDNVSQVALKLGAFRGSKKALLIWCGLTLFALIGIFSGWEGSIVSFIVFGLITFFYWRAKTKK